MECTARCSFEHPKVNSGFLKSLSVRLLSIRTLGLVSALWMLGASKMGVCTLFPDSPRQGLLVSRSQRQSSSLEQCLNMGNFETVPPGGHRSVSNSYAEKSTLCACEWVCAGLCALTRVETANVLKPAVM